MVSIVPLNRRSRNREHSHEIITDQFYRRNYPLPRSVEWRRAKRALPATDTATDGEDCFHPLQQRLLYGYLPARYPTLGSVPSIYIRYSVTDSGSSSIRYTPDFYNNIAWLQLDWQGARC
jgi:hypothetical protein